MNDTPPPAAAPTEAPDARARGVALIAAVARNGVIGIGNRLPWRLPDDLHRFRTLTTGHSIIMGRKTWESIGKPLPDRENIVVTRQPRYIADGAHVAASLATAIAIAGRPKPIFIIGGEEIYRAALPLADTLYLTEIDDDFAGDAHFPAFDPSAWRIASRERRHDPKGIGYAFATYVREPA